MPTDDQLIGKVIDGTYEIVSLLGRGGMGVVYKARHAGLDLMRAIKILRSVDQTSRKRFQREASIIGRLDHPNIVKVHKMSVAEKDGMIFLVMDYINGESLSALLQREGALPVDQAIEIFVQICDALDCAANAGIVHRDLKPSNVMLTKQGNEIKVKLLDFGLAKILGGSAQGLTATECLMGSPSYMSPEQCLAEPLDARSDIYSMGILMYQTLTGQLPFQSDVPHVLLRMQVEDVPAPISDLRHDVPEYLQRIVMKSLQKKREDRFQSWAELREAMVGKRQVTNKFQAHDKRKRNKILVGSLAALALVFCITAMLALTQIGLKSADVQTIEQARESLKYARSIYMNQPERAQSILAENEKFLRRICLQYQSLPAGAHYDLERKKQGADFQLYADTLALEFEMDPSRTTLGAEAYRMYYEAFERLCNINLEQRDLCMQDQFKILEQARDIAFVREHVDWFSEMFLASLYLDSDKLVGQTLALARKVGAKKAQINCLISLARTATVRSDFGRATAHLKELMALREYANDDQLEHLAKESLLAGLEPVALEIYKSKIEGRETVDSWVYREHCRALGRVYAQMGNWKSADQYFHRFSQGLHEAEPITSACGSLSEIIDVDSRRGLNDKAKELCEYQIKLSRRQKVYTHEAEALAHLDYAMLCLRTTDLAALNREGKAALEAASKSKNPHFVAIVCLRMAQAYSLVNDYPAVLEMLNKAISRWPDTRNEMFEHLHEGTKVHELELWKAKVLLLLNKNAEGIAILNAALSPESYGPVYRELAKEAFYLAGKAMVDQGKPQDGDVYFKKCMDFTEHSATKDSPTWFVSKANMLGAMHKYSESTENYRAAIRRLKPQDIAAKAELLWRIGANEEAEGKFDSAWLVYDESHKLYSQAFGPSSIQATGMLMCQARTKRQLGQTKEAEKLLLEARQYFALPQNKLSLQQCLGELAVVYDKAGDLAKKKQVEQEIAKLK